MKKDPQKISKTEPFISKFNWKGINYLSGKEMIGESLRKIIQQLPLICYALLEFNQFQNCIIYVDLELLIKKVDCFKNKP